MSTVTMTVEQKVTTYQLITILETALDYPFGSWVRKCKWMHSLDDRMNEKVMNAIVDPDEELVAVTMDNPEDDGKTQVFKVITIKSMVDGLQEMCNSKTRSYTQLAHQMVNPDGDYDVIAADALLQTIVYGEVIYG